MCVTKSIIFIAWDRDSWHCWAASHHKVNPFQNQKHPQRSVTGFRAWLHSARVGDYFSVMLTAMLEFPTAFGGPLYFQAFVISSKSSSLYWAKSIDLIMICSSRKITYLLKNHPELGHPSFKTLNLWGSYSFYLGNGNKIVYRDVGKIV